MNQFSVKPLIEDIQVYGLQVSKEEMDAAEFSYVITQEDQVLGYTALNSIYKAEAAGALWLHKTICHQAEASSKLIRETLMYSWESGYDVVFADTEDDFLREEGFTEVDSKKLMLKLNQKKVLAFELSWDGLKKLKKPPKSENQ